ncbi:MAG: DUF937 domain-containing protein [Proteobacteria bacterium]|nr:DUF937 domain-containing protein [Pseudomonadota bacterium]
MTPNVVDLVQGALGPDMLSRAGERLNEEPNALGRAAGAAVPAVLWRLIERGRAPGGADALLGAMRRTGAARALADPLSRLQAGARPDPDLLADDLEDRLAGFARIRPESAAALLAMLTPLALGAFARIAPTPLNADTLGRTLREQENNVERAFPPGFDLRGAEPPTPAAAPERASAAVTADAVDRVVAAEAAAASGGGEAVLFPAPAPAAQPPATPAPASTSSGGLPGWLLPLLAALILLGVLFFLLRGFFDTQAVGPAAAPIPPGAAAPGRVPGP